MKKKCFWIIRDQYTNDKVQYSSNIGPVDKKHVATSPSVMEWAKGKQIEIL